MIDDPNEVKQDVLEEIHPDLVSYTFSTRGGNQLIHLNKVYQIKKKLPTAADPFRIQWRCKDREHCKTTVRLLSLRENRLLQADYDIQSLHWEIEYRKIIGIYRNFDGKLLHSYSITVSEVFLELIALLQPFQRCFGS
jgi:hypothetical protein